VDIRDKVIVITGAGRGLGRALALGLAKEGARVAVLARDEQQAARTVKEIAATWPDAPEAFGVAADVADEAQVRAAAAAVDAHWGRVDALINNAGWMPPVAGVLDLDATVLRRVGQQPRWLLSHDQALRPDHDPWRWVAGSSTSAA
jgi:NAD(P)-dependent dehydrogenase (short-subunit alcohol dehydrogenase family)